ncbi:SRPBCC family protein [Maricaulis salignorans]|uniref:SRPBCC family protein n=1 Tax=Maricaulis salignorans TaxID=144026 RepID=UPI003A94447C
MTPLKITKTLFLKAPAAHVWKFLTQADRLAEWFHRGGADLVAKGEYSLLSNTLGKEGAKMCWGQVIEFDPPHRLVHTFTHDHLKGVETLCSWTLTEAEGGTVLTLEHTGWEKVGEGTFAMAANHDAGWDEHFSRLRRVVS